MLILQFLLYRSSTKDFMGKLLKTLNSKCFFIMLFLYRNDFILFKHSLYSFHLWIINTRITLNFLKWSSFVFTWLMTILPKHSSTLSTDYWHEVNYKFYEIVFIYYTSYLHDYWLYFPSVLRFFLWIIYMTFHWNFFEIPLLSSFIFTWMLSIFPGNSSISFK